MSAAGSLFYALLNMLHPRMLWLMIWPVLAALALWSAAAFFLLGWIVARLAGRIEQLLRDSLAFLALDFTDWALIAAKVMLYIGFIPLVYMTALVILSIFGMPAMVDHVARRSFPRLERRRGGGTAGSVWNSVAALFFMVVLLLVGLPAWLIPPLGIALFTATIAWANQRLLRYDALAEHADAAEMAAIFREQRGTLFLLGLLMALAAYVPFFGFFVPAFFALAYIHYLLGALEQRRQLKPPMPAI